MISNLLITLQRNFSIKASNQWLLAVIPGLTRNPENIENPGFPITDFGNDKKYAVVIIEGNEYEGRVG
jgi:hypothetical protein